MGSARIVVRLRPTYNRLDMPKNPVGTMKFVLFGVFLTASACTAPQYDQEVRLILPDNQDPFEGVGLLDAMVRNPNGAGAISRAIVASGEEVLLVDVNIADDAILELVGLQEDLFGGVSLTAVSGGRSMPSVMGVNAPAVNLYFGRYERLGRAPAILNTARAQASAISLGDRIVIAGGRDVSNGPALQSTEILHLGQSDDAWAWIEGPPLPGPRVYGAAVELPETAGDRAGWMAIVGGNEDANSGVFADRLNTIALVPKDGEVPFLSDVILSASRESPTATVMGDGSILICGGLENTGTWFALRSCELWDPVTDTSTTGPEMLQPRARHAAARLLDGSVLVSGGSPSSGGLQDGVAKVELLRVGEPSWIDLADMAQPRFQHTATTLRDGRVLLAGGFYADNSGPVMQMIPLDTVEIVDTEAGTIAELPNVMNRARADHAAILLGDGSVLLCGGYDQNQRLDDCERFDPATEQFTAPIPLDGAGRSGMTAVQLPIGAVALIGGTSNTTAFIDETLILPMR